MLFLWTKTVDNRVKHQATIPAKVLVEDTKESAAEIQVKDFKEEIEAKEIIDMSHVSFILVDPKIPYEERLKAIYEKVVPTYNIFLPCASTVETLLEIIEKVAKAKIEQVSFFGEVYSKDLLVSELPSGEHFVLSAFIKE
jgi:hypothetical protein